MIKLYAPRPLYNATMWDFAREKKLPQTFTKIDDLKYCQQNTKQYLQYVI